ncbi:MAG: response regulator [Thermoproteota archaeon]|nr:response regulator [Thermoproteota archaeon]
MNSFGDATATASSSIHNKRYCIVIVDDEKDLLFIYKKALEMAGFEVSAFDDPLQALREFKEHYKRYSLILSDIRMPGMTGYELTNNCKAINPHIKVILISAYSVTREEIIQHLQKDIKIEELVYKPVTLDQLKNIVEMVLQKDS